MKKIMMFFIAVLSFSLTGCTLSLNVTAEQSNVLAEYIADLILKYDKNYDQELISIEPKEQDAQTTQPVEKKPDENDSSAENIGDKEIVDSNSNSQETVQKQKKIAEIIDLKHFNISYSKYGLYDSFPSNIKNSYFVLEATAGKKLLIAELKIKNMSAESKRFEMMSKGISYELTINSSNTYKPIMTLLTNDMQYIDITVDSGKTVSGYLVFEIPKNAKVEKADIVVSNKNANTTIVLK